jgi:hypothetical protein
MAENTIGRTAAETLTDWRAAERTLETASHAREAAEAAAEAADLAAVSATKTAEAAKRAYEAASEAEATARVTAEAARTTRELADVELTNSQDRERDAEGTEGRAKAAHRAAEVEAHTGSAERD